MGQGLRTFEEFLAEFDACADFAYTKINHGFWEGLADAYALVGKPVPAGRQREADRAAQRPYFFEGGFVDSLLATMRAAGEQRDPHLHFGLELSAWPDDNRIIGTPFDPERSRPILEEYRRLLGDGTDGLLLKRAAMDGGILTLFERMRSMRVILVGPDAVAPLASAACWENVSHIRIHPCEARRKRDETEAELRRLLDQPSDRDTCVLLQAGTLAPYWLLRVRPDYPNVRFIDGGLTFSIACPDDLLKRPWGKVYRSQLLETYARLPGVTRPPHLASRAVIGGIEHQRRAQLAEAAGPDATLARAGQARQVAFVEDKPLDFTRLQAFLQPARRRNQWSNYGPAWELLGRAYHHYMRQPPDRVVIPCANGGMALSALAALHACRLGRPLRWAVSAFGFTNTVRGAFADAQVLDVDARGLLSLQALSELPPDSYDGFVVTNPFGLRRNFEAHARFAAEHGKVMLLDNASGVSRHLPDFPYQSFSLHQTKPFGLGEGGLVLVPRQEAELCLSLLGYGPLDPVFAPHWVGNGKLSELACAGHLQRLEAAPEWVPMYEMQSLRIRHLALRAGLRPLYPDLGPVVSTCLPMLASHPIAPEALSNPLFVIGKFYRPLAQRPTSQVIYEHLLNIPSHPDMRNVESDSILAVLMRLNQLRQVA